MNETPMPTGFVTQTPTLAVLQDVLDYLTSKLLAVACELFPNNPETYQLNHPTGAYLLSYQGGKFGQPIDTFIVTQDRQIGLAFNVLARQLYGRDGAIAMCDDLRAVLLGYQPMGCDRKIYAVDEKFIGEDYGIWMYQVTLATQAVSLPTLY